MSVEVLFSLDRIEGNTAVLVGDDGTCLSVALDRLPPSPCAGKMYRRVGESFVEDADAEEARRSRIQALQNRLRRRK